MEVISSIQAMHYRSFLLGKEIGKLPSEKDSRWKFETSIVPSNAFLSSWASSFGEGRGFGTSMVDICLFSSSPWCWSWDYFSSKAGGKRYTKRLWSWCLCTSLPILFHISKEKALRHYYLYFDSDAQITRRSLDYHTFLFRPWK